jgi:pimeloyl-ACP methyl ester carboxylesterase
MSAATQADIPAGRWWGRPLAETRWILEASRLLADPVWYGRGVPRGDGRGVVLVPGFGAGDQTLTVLASWLWRLGYQPALCGFIANVDCSQRGLARVERRVDALQAKTGRRVAVIGHSRGGHYARAIAAKRPELVSHAISMGADLQAMFDCSAPTLAAVELTRRLLERTGRAVQPDCLSYDCRCDFADAFWAPFPEDRVRLTSVYSQGDGVVRWQAQRVPYADCVEVTGSHVGLVFNRGSYRAIGQALAAPEL